MRLCLRGASKESANHRTSLLWNNAEICTLLPPLVDVYLTLPPIPIQRPPPTSPPPFPIVSPLPPYIRTNTSPPPCWPRGWGQEREGSYGYLYERTPRPRPPQTHDLPLNAGVSLGSSKDEQRQDGGVHRGAVRQLLGAAAEASVDGVLPNRKIQKNKRSDRNTCNCHLFLGLYPTLRV